MRSARCRAHRLGLLHPLALLTGLCLLALGPPAGLQAAGVELPERGELEDAMPEGATLSGREIYRRFLENRFAAASGRLRVVSAGRSAGDTQETELYVRWKDRDPDDADRIVSKTLVRFLEPMDIRRVTYLIVANQGQPHDQFIYLPAYRRTRRLNSRGVSMLGTDYTLDDLIFQTVDDAEYERVLDSQVDGVPVYVVRAKLKPHIETDFRLIEAYFEKEHYVLLRAIYQDATGDPLRELKANVETIAEFDGIWIATETKMTDLKLLTSSTLFVERLDANPPLDDRDFSPFRLNKRRP